MQSHSRRRTVNSLVFIAIGVFISARVGVACVGSVGRRRGSAGRKSKAEHYLYSCG